MSRGYEHHEFDIRDGNAVNELFKQHGGHVVAVVHTASQPSHDWAARDPQTTSPSMPTHAELARSCEKFLSRSGLCFYLDEQGLWRPAKPSPTARVAEAVESKPATRYEPAFRIDEHRLHTAFALWSFESCRRSACPGSTVAILTCDGGFPRRLSNRPGSCGAELHGFLSYLMICTVTGRLYRVFGYKGKQVRDNIHSSDLVEACAEFIRAPRAGEVYNIGGGRSSNAPFWKRSNCAKRIRGRRFNWRYEEANAGAITSGGSAMCESSSLTILAGKSLRFARNAGGNCRAVRS